MAIVDEVSVLHTRPIQSGTPLHQKEASEYLAKYHLVTNVKEFGFISNREKTMILNNREKYVELKNTLLHWLHSINIKETNIGLDGYMGWVEFLVFLSDISNQRNLEDCAFKILDKIQGYLSLLIEEMSFEHGITGCCWLIEKLYTTGHIENNPEDILEEIDVHIAKYVSEHSHDMTIGEFVGIGLYYMMKCNNRPSEENKKQLIHIVNFISEVEVNESMTLDVLMLKKACGINICSEIADLKLSMCSKTCTQVSHVYNLYKLYLLTLDKEICSMTEKALMVLPPRLLNLRDARQLVEMLSYNVQMQCI
jgi:hypothetical protein